MVSVKSDQAETGREIYESLKAQILEGALKPGDRIVNTRKLQSRFKVSYYATLAAMKRLEEEGFVLRRRGAGTFVASPREQFHPSATGRRLAIVRAISLEATRELETMFLKPLFDTLQSEMQRLTGSSRMIECPTAELEERMGRERVDVWICVCPSLPLEMPRPDAPAVYVSQDMETVWSDAAGYDVVAPDSRQGGAVAGRHIRDIGCRLPVVLGACALGTDRMSPHTILRREGFEHGWGAPIPDSDVVLAADYTASDSAVVVPEILRRDPRPDAIFAVSDDQAEGVCHALFSHGVRPGREMKVVGFDGQPPRFSRDLTLTTVEAPLEAMGRAAVRMALERAEEADGSARRLLLPCKLRKGETA